mgnify:CR=1 FL=1
MAQVRVAHIAGGLDARHPMARIVVVRDQPGRQRLSEAGPTTLASELARSVEQFGTAAHAPINTGLEQGTHVRAVRRFGAPLSRDAVLLGRQALAPLRVVELEPPWRRWIVAFRVLDDVSPGDGSCIWRGHRRRRRCRPSRRAPPAGRRRMPPHLPAAARMPTERRRGRSGPAFRRAPARSRPRR